MSIPGGSLQNWLTTLSQPITPYTGSGPMSIDEYARQTRQTGNDVTSQSWFQNKYNQYASGINQTNANKGYDAINAQAQKAYGPEAISAYYNAALGGVGRNAGNAGAMAARTAGAHSTNMLNPGSFVMGQYSQSQAPYAQQYGNIQTGKAQAQQQGAEGLTNLMYTLQRAKQGDAQAAQQLQFQYAQLEQQMKIAQMQADAQSAGVFDYLGMGAKAAVGIWGK
jgi:hypothetical protein